jgi:hypothetical protein
MPPGSSLDGTQLHLGTKAWLGEHQERKVAGWALAVGEFDVLLTADKGMEYQQNPVTLPVAILVVRA